MISILVVNFVVDNFFLFYVNDTTLHKRLLTKGYLPKVTYKRLLTKGYLQKVTYKRLLTKGYLQKVTYKRLLVVDIYC